MSTERERRKPTGFRFKQTTAQLVREGLLVLIFLLTSMLVIIALGVYLGSR